MGYFGTDQPAQRNIGQETADTMKAYLKYSPGVVNLQNSLQPQIDQMNLDSMNRLTFGPGGYMDAYKQAQPEMSSLAAAANTTQRTADVQDVTNLGPAAVQAILNANPQQKALMDQINNSAMDLQYGSQLSPEQQRQAQQASRAAMAARGMGGTNLAAGDEVLKQYLAGNQLLQQRQQFALQGANMNQAVAGDPFQAILGRSSGATALGMQGVGMGANASQASVANTQSSFNPWNSYASQLYGQNSGQQAAWAMSQPTGWSMGSGMLGSLGSLGVGAAMAYKNFGGGGGGGFSMNGLGQGMG